jgi:outer membrane lipoprotein carrier protein
VLKRCVILLMCICGLPAAAEDDVNAVIKGVEAAYTDVKTLRADFVQVTRSAAMGNETRQRGRVTLKRPRMMRWEFTQPAGNTFVTNGDQMWVWSAADQQVVISKAGAAGGQGMAQLLDDLNRLGELFDATMVDNSDHPNSVVLSLTPKTEAGFQRLTLRLASKDYSVQSVVMLDAFGNEVSLTFNQVKNNLEIGDDQFTFSIPAGAKVLNADGP